MNIDKVNRNLINSELRDNEDLPVLDFIDSLDKEKSNSLIEVGSGLCRFVDKLKSRYDFLNITCFEINPELAKIADEKGFVVINDSFLNNKIPTDSFDVVHCSHVIEHFRYPEVAQLIDELLRITKVGGLCAIRSPLMWEDFFIDLDHVRPYPPEAIVNYLNNEQQQKKGNNKVKIELIWYRTSPKKYNKIDKTSFFYPNKYIREILNKIIVRINTKMEISWNKYRWPSGKPNGYVLIMRKIS